MDSEPPTCHWEGYLVLYTSFRPRARQRILLETNYQQYSLTSRCAITCSSLETPKYVYRWLSRRVLDSISRHPRGRVSIIASCRSSIYPSLCTTVPRPTYGLGDPTLDRTTQQPPYTRNPIRGGDTVETCQICY
jgi:hypothetical protein